ncbi:helix-turn-helix domain-containing protein [Streptomyces sp. NPDC057445]|uniref:helix-turn-helix domain-containing protein n=1 Tax=Streptomyces sp. NPDC057445 TaxID=3346136 RepID=UPI0036B014D9
MAPGDAAAVPHAAGGRGVVRLAKRCNMSQTKISNIESGKLTPAIVDVEPILHALGAEGPLAGEILALARSANTEWQDHPAMRRVSPASARVR